MTLVKHGTVEEKAILTPAPKSKALEEADRLIQALEERNRAREEKAGIKRAPYVPSLAAPALMLAGADPDARVIIKPGATSTDRRLSGVDPEARVILPPQGKEAEKLTKEQEALTEEFKKNVTESAPLKMEKISQVLEQRKNKSKENLEKMGANWLSKSLEAFKNVSPKYKIALGLTLAGASVATGGLTALVGAGIMKGMASVSYGAAIYDTMLKAKQDRGFEVNKAKIATNAIALGIIASLTTSWVVGEVFSHMNTTGAMETVKEKVSTFKDSIKSWFLGIENVTKAPESTFEKMPINGLVMDNGLTSSAEIVTPTASLGINESIVSPGAALATLSPYTIQSGDNLTNIIKEQILKTIPGIENLNEFQKNNIVENYLRESAKHKGEEFFSSVNQFANPHSIQQGVTLDLAQMRQGMMSLTYPHFGGATLLEHAKTITGSTSVGGVFSSGTSDVRASFAVEPPAPAIAPYLYPSDADVSRPSPNTEEPLANTEKSNLANQMQEAKKYNNVEENPRIKGLGYLNNA